MEFDASETSFQILAEDTLSGTYTLLNFEIPTGNLDARVISFTKSVSTFVLDSEIFKVFVGDPLQAVSPYKIRATGSSGFAIYDGYDSTTSCLQITMQADTITGWSQF